MMKVIGLLALVTFDFLDDLESNIAVSSIAAFAVNVSRLLLLKLALIVDVGTLRLSVGAYISRANFCV